MASIEPFSVEFKKANLCEVIFKSVNGNLLEGPGASTDRQGACRIFDLQHKSFSPTEADSRLATGRAVGGYFEFVKEIDKVTPLLFQALFENHACEEIEINLMAIDNSQQLQVYFQYSLKNARIISVENFMPALNLNEVAPGAPSKYLEKITVAAQTIRYTYMDGGIEHEWDYHREF